jgi:hypothetical protein
VLQRFRRQPRRSEAGAAPAARSGRASAGRGHRSTPIAAIDRVGPGPRERIVRARSTALAPLARRSRLTGDVGHAARASNVFRNEKPLVVAGLAAIRSERVLFAFASHPSNTADGQLRRARHGAALTDGRRGRLEWRGRLKSRRLPSLWSGLRWSWLWLSTRHARRGLARGRNDHELAVLCHGVLVFLAKVSSLDQEVDAGRVHRSAGALPLLTHLEVVKGDRAGVLLPAKDELGLFLAAGLLTPHWHRDGHQNGHDSEHHQQRRHRVPLLVFLPGDFVPRSPLTRSTSPARALTP